MRISEIKLWMILAEDFSWRLMPFIIGLHSFLVIKEVNFIGKVQRVSGEEYDYREDESFVNEEHNFL